MIHKLKIEKPFWELIRTGKKTKEIRKMNKSSIIINDEITFISLDENEIYGSVKVEDVSYVTLNYIKEGHTNGYTVDDKTKKWILENYKDEKLLICFDIKTLKEE